MTTNEAKHLMRQQLAQKFGDKETAALTNIIFEELMHYSQVDVLLRADHEIPDIAADQLPGVIERLLRDEPVQHIFGRTTFHGLTIKVTPDTLIPRPETAELVDLIVDNHAHTTDLRVLDIGTGSGCIAVALARSLKFANVAALDISPAALAVAKENAAALKTKITFYQEDILACTNLPVSDLDIIVSNPPYICDEEKAQMEPNVLNYEPHQALFVPNDDPLRFYNAIAALAANSLRDGGMLYFEINPRFHTQLTALLRSLRFTNISTHRDFFSRIRFISAQK